MRGIKLVVLGIAISAGVGAVVLVQSELSRAHDDAARSRAAAERPDGVASTQVLVVARDLPRGHRISADNLRWQDWPAEDVPQNFITRDEAPSGYDLSVNVLTRQPMVAGEPLTDARLVRLDHPGVLSAMVRPGMRAFAIEAALETGAGGFILPGDYVDVILTRDETIEQRRPNGEWREYETLMTDTLIRSVRVLAVDDAFSARGGQATTEMRRTATLELTPEMAELMSLADEVGRVTLALRPITELVDQEGNQIDEPMPELAVNLSSFPVAPLRSDDGEAKIGAMQFAASLQGRGRDVVFIRRGERSTVVVDAE